jgi:hypothetical protein
MKQALQIHRLCAADCIGPQETHANYEGKLFLFNTVAIFALW